MGTDSFPEVCLPDLQKPSQDLCSLASMWSLSVCMQRQRKSATLQLLAPLLSQAVGSPMQQSPPGRSM